MSELLKPNFLVMAKLLSTQLSRMYDATDIDTWPMTLAPQTYICPV